MLCTVDPLIKDPTRSDYLSAKDIFSAPKIDFPYESYVLNLSKEDDLSTENKMACPKVSFIRRSHCRHNALAWCFIVNRQRS